VSCTLTGENETTLSGLGPLTFGSKVHRSTAAQYLNGNEGKLRVFVLIFANFTDCVIDHIVRRKDFSADCSKYRVKFCQTIAKSYAPMSTKWQKMFYLICCLNLLLRECNHFFERFMLL